MPTYRQIVPLQYVTLLRDALLVKDLFNTVYQMSGQVMRRVYVVINSPTGVKAPYVVNILKANPYLTKMYEDNIGCTLSKRNIERIGEFMIPCGARYQMLPYDIRENFFTTNFEAAGPDFTDLVTAQYLQEQREKRMK